MSISTYGELKTAVANWLERSDLTSRIPEFISLAETRINQELRSRENEKRITATFSTEYFDIPTNMVEIRNIQLDTDPIQHLNYVSPEQMDIYRPTSTTGQPKVYTIHGDEFQVKPVPDTTYTAQMTYFYELTAFSADNDSNTVLTKFPGLYLYGALIAAAPFVGDSSLLNTWVELYTSLMDQVNNRDRIGRFSGTFLYSKPRSAPE
jgi:hypothetical protein